MQTRDNSISSKTISVGKEGVAMSFNFEETRAFLDLIAVEIGDGLINIASNEPDTNN